MKRGLLWMGASLVASAAMANGCSSKSSRDVVQVNGSSTRDSDATGTDGGVTATSGAAAGTVSSSGGSVVTASAVSSTSAGTSGSVGGGASSTGLATGTGAGGVAATSGATNATSSAPSTGAGGAATSGSPTTTGAGTTGGNPEDVLFADDFEDGTVGQQPAGWDNFIAWNANGANPSGDDLALVDDSQAHGGAHSVHFHGGSNPAQLTRALPSGTNRLYVRAYVRMSRQLGQNPGANHETLIAIRGTPGGANDEVRFGEIKGVIGTNEVPSDNISPLMDQWGMGPVVPADTWACFEVAFLGDQATHELHAWVDGTEVHSITDPMKEFQNGAMPATWLSNKFSEVVIGWHSFSSANADVWMDDLVVALSPIGC